MQYAVHEISVAKGEINVRPISHRRVQADYDGIPAERQPAPLRRADWVCDSCTGEAAAR